VSSQDSENRVDGWFSCPTRWCQQHDHKKLLANDISVTRNM